MNDYGLSSYTGEVDTAMNVSDSPSQTGKAALLRNFLVQVLGTYKWDKGKGMSQVYRNRSPSRVQGKALENKLKVHPRFLWSPRQWYVFAAGLHGLQSINFSPLAFCLLFL